MSSEKDHSLDNILVELGDFGKYQILVFSLVCIAVVIHSGAHVAFVFTAMDLNYRCEVPNCDKDNPNYKEPWLENAIPFNRGKPLKCDRFVSLRENESCSDFNIFEIEKCDNFVYASPERTILQEYNIQCDENLWKLTMVGTINNIGQFFGLFLSGVLSDKFGRKEVLVWGMVLCGLCGIIRTFMPTYELFLLFEFLDAAFGSGTYICGFVLGVELVGPKNRVLTGVLASSCYAVGEIVAAGTAWLLKSWRPITLVLYTPALLLLSYLWIVPESIRWNLSKGRIEEAKETIRTVARFNNNVISESTLNKLTILVSEEPKKGKPAMEILRSTPLLLRLINCCFCWITCTFLFYGLTLNSVTLAGNPYLDFILSALVEVPAYIGCSLVVDRWGRRNTLLVTYFFTGFACIGFIFVPGDMAWLSLTIYLLGKFGATAAFTVLYVLTSEIFPTSLRHSLMGICSTFGRIGSMVAPQTPLLSQIWYPLPLILFASMASIAGILTMLFPETLNVRLPDTVEEAVNIGKKNKSDIQQ